MTFTYGILTILSIHCIFLKFDFERERAHAHASKGGAEREGDIESKAGSRL